VGVLDERREEKEEKEVTVGKQSAVNGKVLERGHGKGAWCGRWWWRRSSLFLILMGMKKN
jgi:hypothetical protein